MAHTSLLKRANFDSSIRPFSPAQLSQKMALDHLNATIENPSFLSSMLVGSAAYRFSKWAFVEAASLSKLASLLPKPVLGASSTLFALSSEVTAFRSAHQILEKGYDTQFHKEVFERKAWLGTAIDFGSLKGIGILALNANPILRSTLQSAGMVAARDLSAALNISPAETGTYVERIAQAQVTQWGMGAGIGLFHHLNSGRIQNHEIAARLKIEALLTPAREFSKSNFHTTSLAKMRSNDEEELDELGAPKVRRAGEAPPPATTQDRWRKFTPYFLKFRDGNRNFFKPLQFHDSFGPLGISEAHGTVRIGKDGISLVVLTARDPHVLKNFNGDHVLLANEAAANRISETRYAKQKDIFPIYAALFWFFFLQGKHDFQSKRYRDLALQIAQEEASGRFLFLTVNFKGETLIPDFQIFTRRAYGVEDTTQMGRRDDDGNLELHRRLSQQFLAEVYARFGIDPLLFALRMQNGMIPGYYLSTPDMRSTRLQVDVTQGRSTRSLPYVDQIKDTPKSWTLDIFQELLSRRPWTESFIFANSDRVASAGALYPHYYRGPRPNELNALYYNLRDPDIDPISKTKKIEEAAGLMEGKTRALLTDANDPLLLPMISGAFPTNELGLVLSARLGVPIHLNAWNPRPPEYGHGLEARTLAEKMDILNQVLSLTEAAIKAVKGKTVLIIDDNATDYATFLMAQLILLKAGATQVKLVTLTSTIRNAQDLEEFVKSQPDITAP